MTFAFSAVPNYAIQYKFILFYTMSAHWARFGPNGPVRYVFHELKLKLKLLFSHHIYSFILLFFLDPVANYALPYKSILFYMMSAHWARFGPNGPVRSVFMKLKLLFSHHIY